MDTKTIGKWAFILAFVCSIIAAFVTFGEWGAWVLILLGVLGGWFRVSKASETGFFVLAIALGSFYSAYAALPVVGGYLTDILSFFMVYVAAVALTVVLKNVYRWLT